MGDVLKKQSKLGVKKSRLTDKQRIFISEYLANGCDARAAAIMAGGKPSSAAVLGNKYLKQPLVARALRKAATDWMGDKKEMAIRVVNQLNRLLTFNLMEVARKSKKGYLEVDADQYEAITPIIGDCVTEVEFRTITNEDGSTHTVFRLKLMSKDRALELAMKYCELLTDKSDVTVKTAIDWSKLYEPVNGQPNDIVEGMIEESIRSLPAPGA